MEGGEKKEMEQFSGRENWVPQKARNLLISSRNVVDRRSVRWAKQCPPDE